MASNFLGGFGAGFPFFNGFERPPFDFPMERSLSIPQALEISQREWNHMKERISCLDSGLGKLLDKSTEKPTLRKILTSIEERKEILNEAEGEMLDQFFQTLGRLEQVRNAMPIIQVLKEKIDLNTMLSDTVVHSTIHEEITELVKKGVSVRSRFRATISVIPRLLDSLLKMIGAERRIPMERDEPGKQSSSSSNKPSQATDGSRKKSAEAKEEESEMGKEDFGDLDMDFKVLQHAEEFRFMQSRAAYQVLFGRSRTDNRQLKKENALLQETIKVKDKEIENLKREIQIGTKHKDEQEKATESNDEMTNQTQSMKELDLKLQSVIRRLDLIEAGGDQRKSSVPSWANL